MVVWCELELLSEFARSGGASLCCGRDDLPQFSLPVLIETLRIILLFCCAIPSEPPVAHAERHGVVKGAPLGAASANP